MKRFKHKVNLMLIANLSVVLFLGACSSSVNKTGAPKTKLSINEIKSDNDLPDSDFFKSEKIADNIVRIHGITGELMYLVEGAEKAALIDTGCGVGDLREYVEKITSKPIIVLLTHGHLDHAAGTFGFHEVYMNHADDEIYTEHNIVSLRKAYIEMSNKEGFDKLKESDYVKHRPASDYKDLKPGDVFELGGTTLEIYNAAGHTQGSVAILFKEAKTLLLGDAANYFIFLFDKRYSLGTTSYEKNMKDLLSKTEGSFDKIYLSHGAGDAPKELLAGVIQVCEDIKSGNVDDVPFEFMGQNAYVAKATDDKGDRVDKGIGNICYDKDKIFD